MNVCVACLHCSFICVVLRSSGVATALLDKITTYVVQERTVQSCLDYVIDAGLNILPVAYSQHLCRPGFKG
jgi:hypothetical protein